MRRRWFRFRGETRKLDEQARSRAPGRFVGLPDGRVHYELQGPSGGQPVVLITGFSVPYFIWDPTIQALTDAGLHTLRYDLFGRGYSDRPDVPYNQDLFDRQLAELLHALDIDRPVDLVGLSMGGAISAVYADRHPDCVRRICLIDPVGLPMKRTLSSRLTTMPIIGEMLMNFRDEKIIVSRVRDYFYAERDLSEFKARFREQMQYTGFRAALLSTLRNGVRTGAEKSYARVGQTGHPVLLIWGQEDRVVPIARSQRVRELIPQCEFHVIENAAHTPHFEKPKVVNPLLTRFLASGVGS